MRIRPNPWPAPFQDSIEGLDVASSAVVGVTRAARAVAAVTMARDVGLALDDNAVAAVVVVDEESQEAGEEEEDAVPKDLLVIRPVHRFSEQNLHDAKGKASFEHGALLVNVQAVGAARDLEEPKIRLVGPVGAPVRAVGIGDSAQAPDGADEGTNEEKVHESDETGRVFCARVEEQGPQRPHCA